MLESPVEKSVGFCSASNWNRRVGGSDVLLSDAIQRGLVVETEITSVDDVVGFGLLGKIVQGAEVACLTPAMSMCGCQARLAHGLSTYLEHLLCRATG